MAQRDPLLKTLDDLAAAAEDSTLTFGELLEALDTRGFGPFLMVLSALVVLPTGTIPLVPAVVGAAIFLLGAQLIAGRNRPWFPDRIKSVHISPETIRRSVGRARPAARWLSGLLAQRLTTAVVGPVPQRVIAVLIILASIVMIPLGFIPFLPMLLGLAILCFGLGMTVRDGVVTCIGYVAFVPAIWITVRWLI